VLQHVSCTEHSHSCYKITQHTTKQLGSKPTKTERKKEKQEGKKEEREGVRKVGGMEGRMKGGREGMEEGRVEGKEAVNYTHFHIHTWTDTSDGQIM